MQDALGSGCRDDSSSVYSVSRDFVRACQTPMLIMPDDMPAHSYAVSMEVAALAPKAEVTVYPWKEPTDRRARTAEAMGAGPLEDAWKPCFPNARAKHMGHYGHFLQWEAPEAVNGENLAFLSDA
ncbi:MAG: hypothetical protein OEU26_12280 [Candidatus Tectomicrobia bacterium]|nr:hypothetical protein [Candidatus Tectomicrobia bacterium]